MRCRLCRGENSFFVSVHSGRAQGADSSVASAGEAGRQPKRGSAKSGEEDEDQGQKKRRITGGRKGRMQKKGGGLGEEME